MKFHPKKGSVLRITRSQSAKIHNYHLHDHILKTETDSKYLGVTVNNQLSWNNHIDILCNKANITSNKASSLTLSSNGIISQILWSCRPAWTPSKNVSLTPYTSICQYRHIITFKDELINRKHWIYFMVC